MRFNKIILAWATLLAIIAYLISTEVWAKQPEQIIERLDNQYYYPHHHGLNKLAVRIRWEQLDISSETGKLPFA